MKSLSVNSFGVFADRCIVEKTSWRSVKHELIDRRFNLLRYSSAPLSFYNLAEG